MYPLFESIKCFNGRIYNIAAHNRRVNSARRKHYGASTSVNLRKLINVPEHCVEGLFKCRISYGLDFDRPVFSEYKPKRITSLKLVESKISYDFKWEAREELDKLFASRGLCDDVLIVKEGFISDTSYANIALFDGQDWFTPKVPLLKGTMRDKLLSQERIRERDIPVSQLRLYQKISLINALNSLGSIQVKVSDILYR